MKLLTAELRAILPPLYSQEKVTDPIVHCKFFTPDSNWTWFATEGEAEDDDFRFFGYVCGLDDEWGYFVLQSLNQHAARSDFPLSATYTSSQAHSVKSWPSSDVTGAAEYPQISR